MTHFLISDENPEGHRLEEILSEIRKDIVRRANKIIDDDRPEARHVLENNIKILEMLSDCIGFAEDSTRSLDKSFGPSKQGVPRIGNQ